MRTPRASVNQATGIKSSVAVVNTDNTTMKALYETLIEYKEEGSGRSLISLFMSLPSRKDYPDYYEFIQTPIAMNTIHDKLEKNKYPTEEALMDDFRLMFQNCKSYNEDGSQIYNDAVTLESVLNKRWKMFERAQETAMAEHQLLHHHHPHNHNHHHHINQNNHHHHHQHHQQQHQQNGNNNTSSTTTTTTTTTTTNNNNNNNTHVASMILNDPMMTNDNISFDGSNTGSTLNSQMNSTQSISNGIGGTNSNNNHHHNSSSTNINNNNNNNGSINHNHHAITPKDTSTMDSLDGTPATPNNQGHHTGRRHRNTDAPKRQLLTGYIIYASEIRKRVIDKNPDQSFGDISRLVGTEWKMLPHEIKSKYEQKALAHNAKVREKAIAEAAERESQGITIDPNPVQTPKLSKRKAAQLAKEQLKSGHNAMNHHNSSFGANDNSMSGLTPNSSQSHIIGHDSTQSHQNPNLIHCAQAGGSSMTPQSQHAHHQGQHINNMMQTQTQAFHQKPPTTSVGIQTRGPTLRFVAPPPKKRLLYSETFKNYIEQLRPDCLHVSKWNKIKQAKATSGDVNEEHFSAKTLSNGIGKHESTAAALWALRDYMLKDSLSIAKDSDFEY